VPHEKNRRGGIVESLPGEEETQIFDHFPAQRPVGSRKDRFQVPMQGEELAPGNGFRFAVGDGPELNSS
jgi:hypothetical protein